MKKIYNFFSILISIFFMSNFFTIQTNAKEIEEISRENLKTIKEKEILKEDYVTSEKIEKSNLKNGYTIEEAFKFDPNTGTILDYNETIGGTDIIIPASINGIDVTTIGTNAFKNKQLKNVSFPENIKYINDNAFSHNNLTQLQIPSNVLSIGENAFGYNEIKDLTIPNSVDTIGDYAFTFCNLTNLTLGNNVKTIGVEAFSHNYLSNIKFNENLSNISNQAFFDNELEDINLPENLLTIGENAFKNNHLVYLNLPESVTSVGEHIIDFNTLKNIEYEKIDGKYIVDLKKINPNIETDKVFNLSEQYDPNTGIITLNEKPNNNYKITYNYKISNSKVSSSENIINLYLSSPEESDYQAIAENSYYTLNNLVIEGEIKSDIRFDDTIKKYVVIKSTDGKIKFSKEIENLYNYDTGYSGFKILFNKEDFEKIGNILNAPVEIKIEYNDNIEYIPLINTEVNKNMKISTGYFDWKSQNYNLKSLPKFDFGKNSVSIEISSNNQVLINNSVNSYGINLLAYYLNDDRYVLDVGIECGNFDISKEEHENIFEILDSNEEVVYTSNAVTFADGSFEGIPSKTAIQVIVPLEYSKPEYRIRLITKDGNGNTRYIFDNIPQF
ncbi:leucine-rich repeat domain-containing protein [Clostridium perfringens]|uniref:leucine-rich repeat domain-containing protein n=1 Tax=Clostridium perfringens TaxID=1502 RepID=UPI0024BC3E8D|nr:leucine-rich repeat domain-containing protein [Clostridium perfringens]